MQTYENVPGVGKTRDTTVTVGLSTTGIFAGDPGVVNVTSWPSPLASREMLKRTVPPAAMVAVLGLKMLPAV